MMRPRMDYPRMMAYRVPAPASIARLSILAQAQRAADRCAIAADRTLPHPFGEPDDRMGLQNAPRGRPIRKGRKRAGARTSNPGHADGVEPTRNGIFPPRAAVVSPRAERRVEADLRLAAKTDLACEIFGRSIAPCPATGASP